MRRGVTNAIYRRAESEILPVSLRIKRSGKEVKMSEKKVSIEQMAEAVMDGLIEYAGLATDVMKDCVTKAGNTVKSEVKANAPVRTGQYKKGWAVKKQKETTDRNASGSKPCHKSDGCPNSCPDDSTDGNPDNSPDNSPNRDTGNRLKT